MLDGETKSFANNCLRWYPTFHNSHLEAEITLSHLCRRFPNSQYIWVFTKWMMTLPCYNFWAGNMQYIFTLLARVLVLPLLQSFQLRPTDVLPFFFLDSDDMIRNATMHSAFDGCDLRSSHWWLPPMAEREARSRWIMCLAGKGSKVLKIKMA